MYDLATYRSAKLDTVLQSSDKVAICQFDDVDVVGLLHVLYPLVSLTLGVDHQGPATGVTGKINVTYINKKSKISIKYS